MKSNVDNRIKNLNENYKKVNNTVFTNFYCPILYKDEKVELCRAHIINQAFRNSARAWTVQRKDVDNFYGHIFEAEFTNLQYSKQYSPADVISDLNISKKLKPKIILNGNPINYYYSKKEIPEDFSPAIIEHKDTNTRIALKMEPEELMKHLKGEWDIDFSKDLRLQSLVSLIKSAHLTLFEMFGYDYVFTAGGHLVGFDILGKFFIENSKKKKQDVLDSGLNYFKEFANMVRPLSINNLDLEGTISDYQFLICIDPNGITWAIIVFIRIIESLHAVLIPTFSNVSSIPKFLDFLNNNKENIDVNYCKFTNEKIEVNKTRRQLKWSKTGILYPETI